MQTVCPVLSSVACLVLQYFSQIISKAARFWGGWGVGGGIYWIQDVCFDFLYNFCLTHLSFKKEFRHVLSRIDTEVFIYKDFNETLIFSADLKKNNKIKFNENPSSGSRVISFRQTDGQKKTKKLISLFEILRTYVKRSLQSPMVTICTTSLTFDNSTFSPHSVFMCFVWIWEQTAIISLQIINWLVFTTETECVYWAVRDEFLPTQCICVFRLDLRTKSDYFPVQQ